MEPRQISPDYQEFNGIVFYFDGHYYTRLLNGKRVMLHRMVWEFFNGEIGDSKMHVHHIDHNPHNNSISNLQLMNFAEHQSMHMLEPERVEAVRKNMLEVVHSAAAKWHKSEEGREAHRELAKKTGFIENRPTLLYTCEECGKPFEATSYSRQHSRVSAMKYCCLNCKMRAFRRRKNNPMLAVDLSKATEKTCEVCGKSYMTNRPDQSKHCGPKCTRKASWLKRKLAKEKSTILP